MATRKPEFEIGNPDPRGIRKGPFKGWAIKRKSDGLWWSAIAVAYTCSTRNRKLWTHRPSVCADSDSIVRIWAKVPQPKAEPATPLPARMRTDDELAAFYLLAGATITSGRRHIYNLGYQDGRRDEREGRAEVTT